MKSIDWPYDFSALPHWGNHESMLYIGDVFTESPYAKYLCALYANCEVSMMNYMGFLAVLKNKVDPELILNVTAFNVTDERAFFTADERYLIVQAHLRKSGLGGYADTFLVIDLNELKFAFVHNSWTQNRAFDTITEVDQSTVVIQPRNVTVQLSKLIYEPLCKINNVKAVRFEKKLFGERRLVPVFD